MFDINTAIWMFPALFALVFLGIPVAISLLVTALLFGLAEFGSVFPTKIHSSLRDTFDMSIHLSWMSPGSLAR